MSDNAFCGAGVFSIFFGALFAFMLGYNIPDYYESNPLKSNDISEKYNYFTNSSASEGCNEMKEYILVNDKTLSEMFPNPNTIIAIAKIIEWITIIVCIYLFCMLFVKRIKESIHKIFLYIEIGIGIFLSILWIIIITIEKTGCDKYNYFLGCENVNKDNIKTIPDFDDVYDLIFFIIFYIFYLALYFATIYARYYVFKNDGDYHLI